MNCDHFKRELSLFARAELEESARMECEEHARECPACREHLRETRALERMIGRGAGDDAARAEAALEGFEERLWTRLRRERMAEALGRPKPGRLSWRLAFAVSLALNLGACFYLAFVSAPPERLRAGSAPAQILPAGLPASSQLLNLFDEEESLFGRRLNWVAATGGEIAMGIINDPADGAAAQRSDGPRVALVYWLTREGGGVRGPGTHPVIILSRSGRMIRQAIPAGQGSAPLEIAVESFTQRRGGFAIETLVRAVNPAGSAGETFSSLAAAVCLAPGAPTKLGEVRLGDQLYNTYLAIQLLDPAGGHERTS